MKELASLPLFLVAMLFASVCGAQAPRSEVTSAIAGARKVATQDGIEELKAVPIGGISQWISVRGRSRDNPILLFIHGGPASTDMPVAWSFQTPWEDYFTVVQWDQRGAGKTYLANDPAKVGPTISKDRIVADAEELVKYLRTTYSKQKIFVLGHSWGTLVGLELALRRPEWLYAYIGMGQIVDMRESERLGYEWLLREAAIRNDTTALAELRAIAPYPETDGTIMPEEIGVQRKWSVRFGGLAHGRSTFSWFEDIAKLSPDYSLEEVAAVDKGSALSFPRLWPEMSKASYLSVKKLGCPLIIFNGRHDYTTSAELAARWFEAVSAPSKRLVWFENSAHMIHMEEPGRVLVHLVADVRPLGK